MSTFKLPVEQVGLERSIQKAMDQFNRKPLKINVDDRSFTQPLGRITGAADEFTKSIEASNARVVAFGASVAVIDSVKNAFSQLVVQTIKVEKALADINVVMGTSSKNLDKFGNSLFKIAKNTAQSFDSVASAATEFARQGLSMEETLKRTSDALVLTRLTGMKAADSVKGLTAAINAFGEAGLTTANIMNKLAAVDMAFAVSSEDLIDGLSRASAVAQDAGMNIDQLIGAITAAQQITARGGAVIGNSFKTIFTRIQRPQTIEQLEMLGVAVKDMQGNVIPAIKILENLAKTYDTLSQSQQSNIAQLVGGMFQINTLKAAMRDLGKENSITARAIQISSNATDEAVKKNEQLNKTLDALLTKTGLSLQKLAEQIGSITVGPGIEKILKAVNGLADGISNVLDGDSIGSTFANGFLKGLGNVISGPGAVLILGLVGKLFVDVAKFARTSIANFMGMTSEAQKQKAVQESILNLLRSNHEVVGSLIGQGQTKRQQEQVILDLIIKQTAAQREQVKLAQHLSRVAVNVGANENLIIPERGARRSASGYIPNFNAKQRERNGAIAGGYAPGSIKSMDMPSGQMVIYNTAEKVKKVPGFQDPFINPPLDSRAGKNHRQKTMEMYGFDPYANKGFIPNFARKNTLSQFSNLEDFKSFVNSPGFDPSNKPKITTNTKWVQEGGYSKEELEGIMGGSRTGDRDLAAEAARQSKQRIMMDGSGYAVLVPSINRPPSYITGQVGQFSAGGVKGKLGYTMNNLLVAGPQSPAGDNVTDPQESALEDSVSQSIFQSSAQFSNAIKPTGAKGVNAPTIKKKLESTPGGKGAIGAAVGAAFEAAVAQAYGIDSAMSAERGRGDFDVNLSNTKKSPGSMQKVRNLFGIPGTVSRMDFKASDSLATVNSMAKKIFNDNKAKYLAQIGQTASSGFIPSFAKDHPLIEAIQREKDAGVPVSKIRVNQSNRLKSSNNPMGLAVTNTRDEPRGMKDVPNFAKNKLPGFDESKFASKKVSDTFENIKSTGVKLNQEMEKFVAEHRKYAQQQTGVVKGLNKETVMAKLKEKGLSKEQTAEALRQLNFSRKETDEAIKQIDAARKLGGNDPLERRSGRFGFGEEGRIGSRLNRFQQSQGTFARGVRGFGNFTQGFGATIGLPMAGGLIDQGLSQAFGGDRTSMTGSQRVLSSAAGSITTGMSSGALLGGAIGSIVPVIGTAVGSAVGAAIGGAGGLISALGKSELTQEELSEAVQQSVAIQTELNNTIGQLEKIQNTQGLSSTEIAKKLQDIIKSTSKQGVLVNNRTVGEQLEMESMAGPVSINRMKEIIKDFEKAQASKTSGLSTRESLEAVSKVLGKSGQNKAISQLSDIFSDQDKISKLKALESPSRGPEFVFDASENKGNEVTDKYVTKLASILNTGLDETSQEYNDLKTIVEKIAKDENFSKFKEEILKQAEQAKKTTKITEETGVAEVNTLNAFLQLERNIKDAANKSATAFKFLRSNLKIKQEINKYALQYKSLNQSVSNRIKLETEFEKTQAQAANSLAKSENLESVRQKLLTDVLKKIRAQGATQDNIEKFANLIENANSEIVETLVDSPEKLETLLGLEGSLSEGRELLSQIRGLIDGYKDKNALLDADLQIQKDQAEVDEQIKLINAKRSGLMQQLNSQIQKRLNEISKQQFEQDISNIRTKGAIARRFNTPFPAVGEGAQELLNLQKQDLLAKEDLKNLKVNIALESEKIFTNMLKDQAIQDRLISANKTLEKSIYDLEKTNRDLVNVLSGGPYKTEDGPYPSKSSSEISDEIKNKESQIKKLQNDKVALEMAKQAEEKLASNSKTVNKVAQKQLPQVDFISALGYGNKFSGQNPIMKAISQNQRNFSQPGDLSLAFADWNQQQKSISEDKATKENTKTLEDFDSEISALNSEISNLRKQQRIIDFNKPLSDISNDSTEVNQGANLNNRLSQIFGKLPPSGELSQSQKGIHEEVGGLLKQQLIKLAGTSPGFSEAAGDLSDLPLGEIQDKFDSLANDFPDLSNQAVQLTTNMSQLAQDKMKEAEIIKEGVLDREKERENIRKSTNVFSKLKNATENAVESLRLMQLKGDSTGYARGMLDLQKQYDVSSPTARVSMQAGGFTPMGKREAFLSGVALNDSAVKTSETTFYETLGRDLPRTFADNMAKALTEAGAGIKSWGDAFQDVALSFLNTLNQAIQRRLADQILGAINTGIGATMGNSFKLFSKGGVVRRSDGGEVYGGSGTKDDVPAMLNSGEYVIRKSAVNKYGKDFLTAINSGTVKQRNQGGTVGPADPTRELEAQTGEGGFLVSSFGQAGTFEAGNIEGRDNLMSFARQTGTSGARDVISSTGAVDDYGQAIPGRGINMQLEDESAKLSGLGLISGPVADEVMQAKQQALDAVGAYDRNVEALRKYREQRRKAIKNAIKQALIGAAISFGMSQIQSAVQSTQIAKASNTMGLEQGVRDAANVPTGPLRPETFQKHSGAVMSDMGINAGDVYMSGGMPNMAKASSRFAMNGISNPQAYVAFTGGGQNPGGSTRGSTSFTKNLFSRGGNAANSRFAGSGFQVNSLGIASQSSGFFGGFQTPNFAQDIGGGGTVGGIISSQNTSWNTSAGTAMLGQNMAPLSNNAAGLAETKTKSGATGVINNVQRRLTGFAVGGKVTRPSGEADKNVPTLLTGGEFVINKDAVKKHGLSFFNSINAQRLNRGGVVGKNISMPAGSNIDSQSELLQQILDTLIMQGETAESTRNETQTLKETIESKTTNNVTTGEASDPNTNQSAILQSILEEIKNQNTTISQEISNSVQNIIDKRQTSESTEINNSSSSSSSSTKNSSNVSNISNNSNFVDQATIQNDLLSQILLAVQSKPSGGGGGFKTSSGGSGGGVGNININVTVDNKGNSNSTYEGGSDDMQTANGVNRSVDGKADSIAKQIEEAVIKILTDQQRLGGVLQKNNK